MFTSKPRRHALEYAFEMACSNIKYGRGATKEVGFDLKNLGAKRVFLVTDPVLSKLPPVIKAREALEAAGVEYHFYDQTRVEPTDKSFKHAIEACKSYAPDAILAVGGGSSMDTAKAANLYYCHPEADFFDFVNAPIGKAKPVLKELLPLVCVTTTAGTGSEVTGITIFDHTEIGAKTGIGSRMLKPTLGIIDPDHLQHAPKNVRAYCGFDVLCHALESYTAIPFDSRPLPKSPEYRPTYQGSNPISDVWSLHALQICRDSFEKSVLEDNIDCQANMHLASAFAGIGFGNAGVHLCHGMSYPISGNIKNTKNQYSPDKLVPGVYGDHRPIVPHGLSVCITAPAVFETCAESNPEIQKRSLNAAAVLTGNDDLRNAKLSDSGRILSDVMRGYMNNLSIPNGLNGLGYDSSDVDKLIKGTLPQRRVLDLAPIDVNEESVGRLLESSMKNY